MFDEKRTFSEVLSIFEMEPGLKNVYVEGITDVFVIGNYLEDNSIDDIKIVKIDDIDFTEEYKTLSQEQSKLLRDNNKESVCYLASKFKNVKLKKSAKTLCVVDVDFDYANGINKANNYLKYTDYNSVELYLFNDRCIKKVLQQLVGVKNIGDIAQFISSLTEVCRRLFFIHCILDRENRGMVDIDKSLSFDKETYTCSLNFNQFWDKCIINNNLVAKKEELIHTFEELFNDNRNDPRCEIRGHTFMHVLYYFCKKIKTMKMDEDEFSNGALLCLDYKQLKNEQLFKDISSM